MVAMVRYIIAQIKPDALMDKKINIGVIAQTDTEIKCRFVNNLSERIAGRFSPLIFDNLNATYREHFSSKEGVKIYSDEIKTYIQVTPLQREYLDFLRNINKHQLRFSDIKEVAKEADAERVIAFVFEREIPRELTKAA